MVGVVGMRGGNFDAEEFDATLFIGQALAGMNS